MPPDDDSGIDAMVAEGSTVVVGDPSKGILLEGTVLGESGPFEGQVLTLPTGIIACAAAGKAAEADIPKPRRTSRATPSWST